MPKILSLLLHSDLNNSKQWFVTILHKYAFGLSISLSGTSYNFINTSWTASFASDAEPVNWYANLKSSPLNCSYNFFHRNLMWPFYRTRSFFNSITSTLNNMYFLSMRKSTALYIGYTTRLTQIFNPTERKAFYHLINSVSLQFLLMLRLV